MVLQNWLSAVLCNVQPYKLKLCNTNVSLAVPSRDSGGRPRRAAYNTHHISICASSTCSTHSRSYPTS